MGDVAGELLGDSNLTEIPPTLATLPPFLPFSFFFSRDVQVWSHEFLMVKRRDRTGKRISKSSTRSLPTTSLPVGYLLTHYELSRTWLSL